MAKHQKTQAFGGATVAEVEANAGDESSSDSQAKILAAASTGFGPSQRSKKKENRSNIFRAFSALKGDAVPQAVADQVVARVKEQHGGDHDAVDERRCASAA